MPTRPRLDELQEFRRYGIGRLLLLARRDFISRLAYKMNHERRHQLRVHRGTNASDPVDEGAQRGPRQHDGGELLELDFRSLR